MISGRVAQVLKLFDGTPPLETDHFLIRYGERNPATAVGAASHGIRDRKLLERYADALERQYNLMTSPPYARSRPLTDDGKRTLVCVLDLISMFGTDEPKTVAEIDRAPYVLLPSRVLKPTGCEELRWAEVAAAHEVTHVFNLSMKVSPHWIWFDEGLAVHMERELCPDNPEYLVYGLEWTDRPDLPLDHAAVNYQSFVFLRYLAQRFGRGFLSSLWQTPPAQGGDKAVTALCTQVPQAAGGLPFADAGGPDLFASGYCMDSYFIWDPGSFAHDVFGRHRERALADSVALRVGKSHELSGVLDHLACRYYRVRPGAGASGVQFLLGPTSAKIKIEIVAAGPQGKCNTPARLCPSKPDTIFFAGIDHAVIVLVNCGTDGAGFGPPVGIDDRQTYSVTLTGV